MAALYRQEFGYVVQIVGNYCLDIEPSSEAFKRDDRIAVRQLVSMLKLPGEVVDEMKRQF